MKINLDDVIIDVEMVYKPQNRGIYFKYLGDNKFILNSWYPYTCEQIEELFIVNKNKVLRILKTSNLKRSRPDTIHYLGRELNIKTIESNTNEAYIIDDTLYVKLKDLELKDRIIKKFYTEMIEEYTIRVFDDIFSKFSDLKINKPSLKFKYTTTFYGKCFRKDNLIEISGICMKMEPKYIECVIHHELCHFKYMGHQESFYRYFESKLPGCRKLQHELRMLKYKDYI